jgi:hypothetical protein
MEIGVKALTVLVMLAVVLAFIRLLMLTSCAITSDAKEIELMSSKLAPKLPLEVRNALQCLRWAPFCAKDEVSRNRKRRILQLRTQFAGLTKTQAAWLTVTFADDAPVDKYVLYLIRRSDVRVWRQSDRTIPPYVISVIATGHWLDCLPSMEEAVELAEALGLNVVSMSG